MKTLVVGFSVLNRLVSRFGSAANNEFSIRALGGNHFDLLPYLIDRFLCEERPRRVVLDLVSTPRSVFWTEDYFSDSCRYLVSRCQQASATVMFANLYRREVDQNSDFLHRSVNHIADEYGIPVLDLLKLHEDRQDDLSSCYPDGNHPSNEGAIVLGNALESFARSTINSQSKVCIAHDHWSSQVPMAVPAQRISGRFERFGFNVSYGTATKDDPLLVVLPGNFEIHGLLTEMGPRSGRVTCKYGDHEIVIQNYDKFCYYSRLKHHPLTKAPCTELALIQDDMMPDIALAKGNPDERTRQCNLVYVLGTCSRDA